MFISKFIVGYRYLLACALCFVCFGAFAQQSIRPVDRVIAVVNSEIITARELDARIQAVKASQPNRPSSRNTPPNYRRQVLEQMVIERAQTQRARELGIVVDDAQLARGIESIAANNRMTVAQMRARLRAQNVPMDVFREQVRGQIIQARLREVEVESRIQVSDADVDSYLADPANKVRSEPEFNVAQIFLKLSETPDDATLKARQAQINAVRERALAGESFESLARSQSEGDQAANGGSLGWRRANQLPGLFMQAIEPLEIGGLSPVVRSPAGLHLLKLVDKRGGVSDAPLLQTRVRHILMRSEQAGDDVSSIRRALERVRERLVDGSARFEAMARQYSVDGSASRGGELGWVFPGDTVPEFERAMNTLKPGEISPIVSSPFGLHLIQVIERRQSSSTAERERQRARQLLIQERAEEAWLDWLAQLRDESYIEYRIEP